MTTINAELPSVYLDGIGESAFSGLIVANEIPERNSIEAPKGTNLTIDIISTNGTDIDGTATDVTINGTLAVDNGVIQSGFSGSIDTSDARHHVIAINPDTDFTSEQVVTVRVEGADITPTDTVDTTYTFTVEDLTAPKLTDARASGPKTVRASFDEGMLATSISGTNDALNPANYTISFVPGNDRQAGVSPIVLSVEQSSNKDYDLTLDGELTFFRNYKLQVGPIADDSVAGNTVANPNDVQSFVSWSPPDWPDRRKFEIFQFFSKDDRQGDSSGDLERILSALQDTIYLFCHDIDEWIKIIDIEESPEPFLDAILCDLGNPFNFDLTLNRKRKLADLLPDIYKQRGTEEGIQNLARFFLGIEISNIEIWNEDSWILGESELGIDTDLAPGSGANLYTFVVQVDQELTVEEERILTELIKQTKVAHEHLIIVEPSDIEFIDHLELGFSELGVNWMLH